MVAKGSCIEQVVSKQAPYGGRSVDLGDEFGEPGHVSETIFRTGLSNRVYLQKATEEGDVVGPFLEGIIEQRERSFNTRCVTAVAFVFLQRAYSKIYVVRCEIYHQKKSSKGCTDLLCPVAASASRSSRSLRGSWTSPIH